MKSFIQTLFSSGGVVNRSQYTAISFILFAIKYNIDRAIAYFGFDNSNWYLDDYLTWFRNISSNSKAQQSPDFYYALAITAIPFIYLGTTLTLKRLRDADLPWWLVILFFPPYVNLAFFLFLMLIPTKLADDHKKTHKTKWLDTIVPKSDNGNALLAILITAIFAAISTWIATTQLRDYGFTLFLAVPFVQGMTAAVLYGYHTKRTLRQSLGVAFLSVIITAAVIFVLAVEGLLCLAMAAPIAIPLALLGGVLGHVIQHRTLRAAVTTMLVFAALPLISWIEKETRQQPALESVTTSVIVNREPDAVWNQLVTFNHIAEPEEWLFRAGIAYPIKAEIDGRGIGAVRRCVFTTGSFIEPIEVWDAPRLLKFSVQDVPPPMIEMSIYDDLHLSHLDHYFVSEKGQFELTPLGGGKTLLKGTTWYRHNIWPAPYWKQWSNFILHTIHYRVLNHIKMETEGRVEN